MSFAFFQSPPKLMGPYKIVKSFFFLCREPFGINDSCQHPFNVQSSYAAMLAFHGDSATPQRWKEASLTDDLRRQHVHDRDCR